MRRSAVLLLAIPLLAGCQEQSGRAGGAGAAYPEARALVERGEYDAALADLAGAGDAEALTLMGQAWLGKAGGARRILGASPGPEEMQALDLFEQAIAARPDYPEAHLAVAELLAPYALASEARGAPAADAGAGAGPVVTVEQVFEAFGGAIQADPADTTAVSAMIEFALKAGRTREAVAGFRELTRRDRENPDLLVRFGDFLAGPAGDPEGALGVYAQALIWRPDDTATHSKIADLHLDAALERLGERAYLAAEAELHEARKHVREPGSAQARRLRDVEGALAEASGRR